MSMAALSQVFAPGKKPLVNVAPAPQPTGDIKVVSASGSGNKGKSERLASDNPMEGKLGETVVAAQVVHVKALTPPSLVEDKRVYSHVVAADLGNHDTALGITNLELKGVLFLMQNKIFSSSSLLPKNK